MQLCRLLHVGTARVGVVEGDHVAVLPTASGPLSALLSADDPAAAARAALTNADTRVALAEADLLAPIDQQEVWAAGVTYRRSQEARMRESEHGATHYDRVYSAPRPEIFFKAAPHRVVGPGRPVRLRADSQWSVPEPELALVLAPDLRLVGFTIGNDMSARDIEGENPLYLPQAKTYNQCAALGPWITLASAMPERERIGIALSIRRGGVEVFAGQTSAAAMKRTFDELIAWLGRDNSFPTGAVLMTGTGIVPPDTFTLLDGDDVSIRIDGIGELCNPVVQGS